MIYLILSVEGHGFCIRSGQLIAELVRTLRSVGREPATVQQTLDILNKA